MKPMQAPVLLHIQGSIAHITLDRPEQLNAIDAVVLASLRQALAEASAHADVRAVLLRGSGEFFSVGGNLKVFHQAMQDRPDAKMTAFSNLIDEAHAVIQLIVSLPVPVPVPVVMAIKGGGAGIALSLMAAGDFVITHPESTFSTAYMKVGASPDGGATWWLPRLMGMRQARKLLMLSELVSGHEALALGLVDRLVALADVESEGLALAERLARGPTFACGKLKALLASSLQSDLATQLEAEKANFLACTQSTDMQEGVRSFLAKESARFIGR